VIIGLSFGKRGNKPGISNRFLGQAVRKLYEEYNLPIILQWEIADCLIDIPVLKRIESHRIKGDYLDTYEVLYQARKFCKEKKLNKPILVAHQDHLPRVIKVAKKLGFKPIKKEFLYIPYDKHSSQPWTRNKIRFLIHEFATKTKYKIESKI
jgi:hypothetical protein